MNIQTLTIAGLVLLMSGVVSAKPSDDCRHRRDVDLPRACTNGSERSNYKKGFEDGVFIADYAFNVWDGACSDWEDDIEPTIEDILDNYLDVSSATDEEFCRVGGITDGLVFRRSEFMKNEYGCCGGGSPSDECAEFGENSGINYAMAYCVASTAAEACYDMGRYMRGVPKNVCERNFEDSCDSAFAQEASYDSDCRRYTNNSSGRRCLTAFENFGDQVCDKY